MPIRSHFDIAARRKAWEEAQLEMDPTMTRDYFRYSIYSNPSSSQHGQYGTPATKKKVRFTIGAEKNKYHQSLLSKILANEHYADIFVNVSPDKDRVAGQIGPSGLVRATPLSSTVVTLNSTYFNYIRNTAPTLHQPIEVNIPQIELSHFELVVEWLYGLGLNLDGDEDFNQEEFLGVYDAAHVLGIDTLKEMMREHARNILEDCSDRKNDAFPIKDPLTFIRRICQSSDSTELEGLWGMVEIVLGEWEGMLADEAVVGVALVPRPKTKDDEVITGDALWAELVIMAHEERIRKEICNKCRLAKHVGVYCCCDICPRRYLPVKMTLQYKRQREEDDDDEEDAGESDDDDADDGDAMEIDGGRKRPRMTLYWKQEEEDEEDENTDNSEGESSGEQEGQEDEDQRQLEDNSDEEGDEESDDFAEQDSGDEEVDEEDSEEEDDDGEDEENYTRNSHHIPVWDPSHDRWDENRNA